MRYDNPVIPGFYPDPSVCRVGEDYYLVTSTFEYFPGVPVFHSRDLVHWRQIGYCLTRAAGLPLEKRPPSKGIYAPTIRHHEGAFYMVTTNVGGGGNFFVTTEDPAGEWSDPVWLDHGGIDPSLLFDDDGTVYLTSSGNQQSTLDMGTGNRTSDIRTTWPGTGGAYLEAPHLYRFKDMYYLLCAEGGTALGHMVTIARSPSPWGPFESCPQNPILTHRDRGWHPIQATGHADLVQAHDESWWMVFLGIRVPPDEYPTFHNLGRETFLAPVTWTNDGWPVVNGNATVELEMDAPCLPTHPWPPEPARDDFDAPALRLCWNFLRNPRGEDWSLTDRPGWLCLKGSAVTLDEIDSPAFVGRRQQHSNCRASVLLDFSPQHDAEEAGLTVLMNHRHHCEIALIMVDGLRTVIVRLRIGDLQAVAASAPAPEGPVTLVIEADTLHYAFGFARGDRAPVMLAKAETRYLSTEVAGGFTGVYFGLYATGNGRKSSSVAGFDWFEYRVENTGGK
ncbi:MAG: glycoside hydrolase family 43 protein [Planctomycetota bacterium]